MNEELELPREARDLARQARRHETPCGDGHLVWHTWGEGEPC